MTTKEKSSICGWSTASLPGKDSPMPTRQESGCIRFELLQNRETPTEFAVVSQWHDQQAVQDHIGTGHARRAMSGLPELLAAPMDLRFYQLGADIDTPSTL
jgi:quinol monooxygenase YgiN